MSLVAVLRSHKYAKVFTVLLKAVCQQYINGSCEWFPNQLENPRNAKRTKRYGLFSLAKRFVYFGACAIVDMYRNTAGLDRWTDLEVTVVTENGNLSPSGSRYERNNTRRNIQVDLFNPYVIIIILLNWRHTDTDR